MSVQESARLQVIAAQLNYDNALAAGETIQGPVVESIRLHAMQQLALFQDTINNEVQALNARSAVP